MDRYHRQSLLPQIGVQGQLRLGRSRVLVVGCGALGTVIAEQLARAGVGFIRIVDRDIVELTNLQRQVLFDEQDVAEQKPKAVAAVDRLRRINSSITLEPIVADVHAGNVEDIAGLTPGHLSLDLILDGTDNVETRYLLNDVSVKHRVPWVYGACVGMQGRAMAIRPGTGACLRCVFPVPPGAGELPTCDTAGVFSPVSAMIASLQAAAAIKILVDPARQGDETLFTVDLWAGRMKAINARDSLRDDCLTCGQRRFEYLERKSGSGTTSLCGRDAVQVRPPTIHTKLDLPMLAQKLETSGDLQLTPYLLRCRLASAGLNLTVFPDGRLIVQGTMDADRARSIYARYIGV